MAELLHAADFEAHLHTTFRIQKPIAVELELAEVKDCSNPSMEQFSLIFTAPDSSIFAQGTRTLHHAALGDQDIFLVPLGPSSGRMRYQAVFSRFKDR